MYNQLASLLRQFIEVDETDIELLRSTFEPQKFKKNEIIVNEGEVCNSLIFINSGYFRVYVSSPKDFKTVHLAGKNDFVCAFSSFIMRRPSFESLEAVTDAEGLVTNFEKLNQLYSVSAKWEKAGRIIMESLFIRKEMRVISFIKNSSEKRYAELMEKDPEIINNVAQQYIASFLGITPETLSRIRKKYSELHL